MNPNSMNVTDTLALLGIAGIGVQRAIDILDPLFFLILQLIIAIPHWRGKDGYKSGAEFKDFPFNLDDKTIKAWLVNLAAFGLGLIIASVTNTVLIPAISQTWNMLLIAFSIGTTTNAANSVAKYADYAKEARKGEIKPLPTITVIPQAPKIKTGTDLQLLATVSGADNTAVTWKVLEANGGTVDESSGMYTAPAAAGIFHVAAISVANTAASAVAVITVE
jgi:hypothetical protein